MKRAESQSSGYTEADLPSPGSVFFIPLENGHFSIARVAKRVTGVDPTLSTSKRQVVSSRVLVIPSSWVGPQAIRPPDEQVRNRLVLNHHAWKGQPQAQWISEPPPAEFLHAGLIPLSEADEIDCVAYGGWHSLRLQPLLQWRWDHDRENLLLEEAAERKKAEERGRQFAQRQAEILRTLTLDDLARRAWFEGWDADEEASFRNDARRHVLAFIAALRSLPKPSKAVVRRNLRQCVESFNEMDANQSLIQTTHREDIVEALELIVSVARHPDLANLIDEWREW